MSHTSIHAFLLNKCIKFFVRQTIWYKPHFSAHSHLTYAQIKQQWMIGTPYFFIISSRGLSPFSVVAWDISSPLLLVCGDKRIFFCLSLRVGTFETRGKVAWYHKSILLCLLSLRVGTTTGKHGHTNPALPGTPPKSGKYSSSELIFTSSIDKLY